MPSWVKDFVTRARTRGPSKPRVARLDLIRLNRVDLDLDGYVYFVQDPPNRDAMGLIKIGYSGSPDKRLSGLRNANSTSLTLLGLVRGGNPLETELHNMLAAARDHGEWFRPTVHVATVIHDVLSSRLRVSDPVEDLPLFIARVAGKLTLGVPDVRP